MCGIVLLYGPNADQRLSGCLARLQHRGPDAKATWRQGQLALGFTRLEINGEGDCGHQPYQYGDLIGAFNGEIYNHFALGQAYGLPLSECDTHIILPLFERQGPQAIECLDGFYSGVVFRSGQSEVFCLRDYLGKKPLFVGQSKGETFITSELKALDKIDWFEALPRGASTVNLQTGRVCEIAAHSNQPSTLGLIELFERSVLKRMPKSDQPLGVFLSGGLDSSIVASFVSRLRNDVTYFVLGEMESTDRQAVEIVVKALGLKDVRTVPLPTLDTIPELLSSVVHTTESFNPSIVSNGLATYLLAKAARDAGIKVVITGEGADELFGGYHTFHEDDPWKETRQQLINDMQFTELRRLDLSCMAHGVEARCPFLDRAIHSFSNQLAYHQMYGPDENKVTLRHSFEGCLPPEVLLRKKTSFDVGSGIRKQVVQYLRRNCRSEREELKTLWLESFAHEPSNPYFHAYPVFDSVIDCRGETHR